MGDDFSGIVHLHGSLEQPRRRLVVTDQDFGHAYLTDAWATQFLHRMFRRYTVLFVGYGHADVVMDYLARGLPRGTSRYALTPDDDLSKWRRLEIDAVPYPKSRSGSHDALTTAIVEWADRTNMGLLDHRQRIADLVGAPPPEDPVTADYLAEALTAESTSTFFAESARGASWLAWAEAQPTFKQLAEDTSSSAGALALARWFVSNFVVIESESQRALKTVQLFGGVSDHCCGARSQWNCSGLKTHARLYSSRGWSCCWRPFPAMPPTHSTICSSPADGQRIEPPHSLFSTIS